MDYDKTKSGPSLKERIILVLEQNNNLDFYLKKEILNVLDKMIKANFPIDESILLKLEELSVVRKPKYADIGKKFNVKEHELSVHVQMLYEDSGATIAIEMILNYLFPNKDPKTEALYQNMIKGIANAFVGESNTSDGFRVNELMSLIIGCDLEMGIQKHPLFMSFCQGNMGICLDKLEQKLIINGLEPQEANKKISNLLDVVDYNSKREKPGFLREAQKALTELFLLTNPPQEQIYAFNDQIVASPDIYPTQKEKIRHESLRGFDVEYNKMIEDYYLSKKLGNTK